MNPPKILLNMTMQYHRLHRFRKNKNRSNPHTISSETQPSLGETSTEGLGYLVEGVHRHALSLVRERDPGVDDHLLQQPAVLGRGVVVGAVQHATTELREGARAVFVVVSVDHVDAGPPELDGRPSKQRAEPPEDAVPYARRADATAVGEREGCPPKHGENTELQQVSTYVSLNRSSES